MSTFFVILLCYLLTLCGVFDTLHEIIIIIDKDFNRSNNFVLNEYDNFAADSGSGSRSGSMGVARSNSSSRSTSAAPPSPAPTADTPTPVPAPVKQEHLPDNKKKSVKSLIALLLINHDDNEVVADVKELFAPQYHADMVTEILNVALEK